MRFFAFVTLSTLVALSAFGWENHMQLSDLALAAAGWAKSESSAESLDSFLEAEKAKLATVLATVEKNARSDYPRYMPLPASLVFDPTAKGATLRASFIAAVRVNPNMPFTLFLQIPVHKTSDRPSLSPEAVDLSGARLPNGPFKELAVGESVSALEVVETASDEPDYGMDIGLFANNGTEWGARYGFGIQPFGNAKLSYGSQSPFHMSFANEDWIIKVAAPKYQGSYVGYRVDLYSALAKEAFASGHSYWGYRFAGWALHYVEDATQPFHSSMLPAKSTFDILVLNAFGPDAKIDGEVVLLSNRHLILENFQYSVLAAYRGDDAPSILYSALQDFPDKTPVGKPQASLGDPSKRRWVLDVVAKHSRQRGRELDRAIVATFPAKYVSDPAFDFGAWQSDTGSAYDPLADLVAIDQKKASAFEVALAPSLADMGRAARAFLAALVPGGSH
ncbi:MAG: phospholipase [Spirochaetota bacterium]